MRKTKQSFTIFIDIKLSLHHFVSFRKLFQSVLGFWGIDVWDHWSFSGVLIVELMDVFNEIGDIFDKLLEELGLLFLEFGLFVFWSLNEVSPVHIHHTQLILLLFILYPIRMVDIENFILIKHRTKLHLNYRLLLFDFIQGLHNLTQRINIVFNIPWDPLC